VTSQNFLLTINPAAPITRHNNVGHWIDVPDFEHDNFVVDQAALAAGTPQPGVPRTGVVYSTSGGGKTAGQSPAYPVADRLNIPGVRGVMMRHPWRELERTNTPGNYFFDRVAGELAQCLAIGNARGSRFGFILFISVNSFVGGSGNPLPPYLDHLATEEAPLGRGVWNTWRWNTTIRTRFAALVQALGAQFDSHPCWEGIATNETATKAANSDPNSGYTAAGFRQGLIDETNAIASACSRGRHFFYQNFFPTTGTDSNLDLVVQAGIANGAMVMCAPDILPGKTALETRVYPRYTTFRGQLPMQCSAQNDSHIWNTTLEDEVAPYDSMQSIFSFARNTLKCNYVMWTWRRTGAGNRFGQGWLPPTGPRLPSDAEVIAATPTWQPSPGWTPT
jgi:hypothetical protein